MANEAVMLGIPYGGFRSSNLDNTEERAGCVKISLRT